MSKNVREKRGDFKGWLKDFLSDCVEEKTPEDIILESSESQEVKAELLKALDKRKKATNQFYKSLRVDTSVDKKQVQEEVKKHLKNKEKQDAERQV